MPEEEHKELVGPLGMNLDVLNVLFSAAMFCYIFPAWTNPTLQPVLISLELVWLFAPWIILMAIKSPAPFIKCRLFQLPVLLVAVFVTILSPVPVSHFQWWAKHEAAQKMRPFETMEITSGWATLKWFTQEGAPAVWYSFSSDRGYHIFNTPGVDPDTNQELLPVLDRTTKDAIVSSFLSIQKKQEEEREKLLKKQAIETKEREERSREQSIAAAKVLSERQQAERQVAEERVTKEKRDAYEKLVSKYVGSAIPENSKLGPIAFVVLDSDFRQDSALSEKISKSLASAGLKNDRLLFTRAFFESPFFRGILSEKAETEQFHAEEYAARILAIQVTTTFHKTEPVESVQMTAADTVWNVRLISTSTRQIIHTREIKETGIGFKEGTAQANAYDRAEVQLAKLIPALAE
jgi:hypothetical protein